MPATDDRLAAGAGVMTAVLWAPMGLVIPELPDLADATGVSEFYAAHGTAMTAILASVSGGLGFALLFLGNLIARLRLLEASAAWTWALMGSALMFLTALCAALGVDAAAVLLYGHVPADTIWALHAVAFLLAAPAAGAGTAFFVAAAALAVRDAALPRWSGWIATLGAVVNAGALAGFFERDGPLNAGNGLIGGLAAPVAAWIVWILALSWAWFRDDARGAATARGSGRVPTEGT
jgi:hypothetical protein